MESLDLLWELEKYDNSLKEIKKELEDIANGEKVKLLVAKLNETENGLSDLEYRLEKNEKRLNNNNSILKELDFQLKEIERDLYGGVIADLKQLNYLDKEREITIKEIEKKEMEILSQMEEMEELKVEFIKIEEDFKNLRIEYTRLVKMYKVIVEELKEKAKEERNEMSLLSSKIDEDVLKMYIQLKSLKGNAVVEVVDNKCSGCNMFLPTFVVDRLKNHKVLIHCENCDRILYLNKQE